MDFDLQPESVTARLFAQLEGTQNQIQNLQQSISTSVSTSAMSTDTTINLSNSSIETEYPKGFKFVLPRPFKGDQSEVESWLFNMEQYFDNTNIPSDKWIRVVISNMNGNATLWWRMRKNRQDEPQDWSNFKIEIQCQFLPKNVQRASRLRLQ